MNSKRRISLIEYLLIISLLSSLTNIICAQNRQGKLKENLYKKMNLCSYTIANH